MLPTYIEEEDKNSYKNIVEVLRYLLLDLNYDIEKEILNSISCGNDTKQLKGLDYDGTKKNKSKLLDILYSSNLLNKVNDNTLVKFCNTHNIKNEEDYSKFKDLNPSAGLRNSILEYRGFYWKLVVDPDGIVYYSSKEECDKAHQRVIEKLEKTLEDDDYDIVMEDIQDEGWVASHAYDPKIPPFKCKYYAN